MILLSRRDPPSPIMLTGARRARWQAELRRRRCGHPGGRVAGACHPQGAASAHPGCGAQQACGGGGVQQGASGQSGWGLPSARGCFSPSRMRSTAGVWGRGGQQGASGQSGWGLPSVWMRSTAGGGQGSRQLRASTWSSMRVVQAAGASLVGDDVLAFHSFHLHPPLPPPTC